MRQIIACFVMNKRFIQPVVLLMIVIVRRFMASETDNCPLIFGIDDTYVDI